MNQSEGSKGKPDVHSRGTAASEVAFQSYKAVFELETMLDDDETDEGEFEESNPPCQKEMAFQWECLLKLEQFSHIPTYRELSRRPK